MLSASACSTGLKTSFEFLDDIAIDNPFAPKFAAVLAATFLTHEIIGTGLLRVVWQLIFGCFASVFDMFYCTVYSPVFVQN